MASIILYVSCILCCYIPVGAVCPILCECKWKSGKESVVCLYANLSTVPQYLDAGTQALDLTGNNLTKIKNGEFYKAGLVNLQKIYLAKCRLANLEKYSFQHLINLIELDLSYNNLSNVPSHIFDSITELRDLKLNGNPIEKIFNNAFAHLTQLVRLEMSDCEITFIEPRAFEGIERTIEWIRLDKNRLADAVASPFIHLKGLHGLELENNPWNCSCALRPLRIWMVRHNVPFDIAPVCHHPERLQMKPWDKLDLDEYVCLPEIFSRAKSVHTMEGNNVTLTCQTAGDPVPFVRWIYKNKIIANLSSSTKLFLVKISNHSSELTIHNVDVSDAGNYVCLAENKAGKTEDTVMLSVSKKPLETRFSGRLLIVSILVGSIIVTILCSTALCVFTVKKKRMTKWQNHDCRRDDNYDRIEMSRKLVKVDSVMSINQNKNRNYRVIPGGDTDQEMEEEDGDEEEESRIIDSRTKDWNSNKSLERTSLQQIYQENLHIPRSPFQGSRENIGKSSTSKCGTYSQNSPTNMVSSYPPLQLSASFRRYIPSAASYADRPDKTVSISSIADSVLFTTKDYEPTCARDQVPNEFLRASKDAAKGYPDIIEKSTSNKRLDRYGSSSEVFQGSLCGKLYTVSRAASEISCVQDINEIFCTLPRKKTLVGNSRFNSTDSESPLLSDSKFGSSGGDSYFNSLDNSIRRLSDASSQRYHVGTNLNRNRIDRTSNSCLNLAKAEGLSNKETTPSAELNATPLLDFSSLESRILSTKREISPPSSLSAFTTNKRETNLAYDYHAAQLEKFLEEYRSLQAQLAKMKENCDNICQERCQDIASTPPLPECLKNQAASASSNPLEDSVDFKNFENELTRCLISENLSPSINKNLFSNS